MLTPVMAMPSISFTVREFERTGAAAIHIEDQITPKRCGHLDGKEVIPLAEMEKKLEAALASRTDPDFCIIARTDARGVHGFDDAIQRSGICQTRCRCGSLSKRRSQKRNWKRFHALFPTFLSWLTSSKAEKLPCSLSTIAANGIPNCDLPV